MDGAIGIRSELSHRWTALMSAGYGIANPDLVELFEPARTGNIGTAGSLGGTYLERGNPDLKHQRRLSGNFTLSYNTATFRLSLALNGGRIVDAIYYDRQFGTYAAGEVFPANDDVKFADLNLLVEIDTLGPFFAVLSASGRRLDSHRYGNRPPYSPRWQGYGQGGLRFALEKYKVHVRLFGEIAHTEAPYSYRLAPLVINPTTAGGINASLKAFTFYYMMHNTLNRVNAVPEGYGYSGWYYSWGINWKFLD